MLQRYAQKITGGGGGTPSVLIIGLSSIKLDQSRQKLKNQKVSLELLLASCDKVEKLEGEGSFQNQPPACLELKKDVFLYSSLISVDAKV